METYTKGNGKTISSMVVEFKSCTTADNTREIGLKAVCMEGDSIRGPMDRNIKESIT
jgi:hypothetical protein